MLIVLSWTALFHALFYKRGTNPWYKKPGKNPKGDRYVRIDGDPKHWDLSECLKEYFGGNHPPERKNLEFLIGLRNKIEHRYLPDLDAGLYGECQAALLNLEELIASEFGQSHSLVEQLAVSLQFSRVVPPEKKRATKAHAASVKTVKEYVEKFRGNLPSSTLNSTKYSFNVYLVPKVANRKELADTVVEFAKLDGLKPEELARLEKLNVLIKEKHIPIANLDLLKPSQVVAAVASSLPHRFSTNDHSSAWRHYGVRPPPNAPKPEITVSQYCVHDRPHKDYLYTDAWVQKLKAELSRPEIYEEVTGRPVRPK